MRFMLKKENQIGCKMMNRVERVRCNEFFTQKTKTYAEKTTTWKKLLGGTITWGRIIEDGELAKRIHPAYRAQEEV